MARLMIVDDERDLAVMLKLMLEKDGHQVQVAHSAEEALSALKAGALPELFILDVMMPVMDGYELAARLHQDARTSSVPVLMLTGRSGQEKPEPAHNVVDQLDKPFNPKDLRERVGELLAKGAA